MERLIKLYHKSERLVAGVMSGTSLDGIDVAIVRIQGSGNASRVEPIAFDTVPFDKKMRKIILAACQPETSDVEDICRLNFWLGDQFAAAVAKVCAEAGVTLTELDLIGSHGQTVYHLPGESTLQIGEPAVIAERTGVVTVADFRVRDVAAGGQGAPLVPYTEFIIYGHAGKTRLLQNIGGIGNVTVLPAGADAVEVTAFDTGPGNMLIDTCIAMLSGGKEHFDRNGQMAARGQIRENMLQELLEHPFLAQQPPKSTGREAFGSRYARKVILRHQALGMTDEDLVATLTYFTARSIADSYRTFIFPKHKVDEVIVSGGGSHNSTLMSMLRQELAGIPVLVQEDLGFSSDAKEAVAFAVLANETISGQANNLPSVTGARHPVIMGKISL